MALMSKPEDNEMISVIHNHHTWLNLTENWIYNQIRYLPEDIQSRVFCKTMKNEDQFPWPYVECLSRQAQWRSLCITAVSSLILRQRQRRDTAYLHHMAKKYKASLFHSHFGHTGWRHTEMIRRMGLKHIVTFYGIDVSRLPKEDPIWIDRYQDMFATVDKVLCEGPHMARCLKTLGCPETKIHLQHLGVEVQEIPFEPRQWQPHEPLRVLIAASFRKKKGIPYALKALGEIKKRINLEVTLMGDAIDIPESQEEKAHILKVIDRYGLHPCIRMPGFQPLAALREEAYRHHIFLSPSITCENGDTEGGVPVSIIEMAATGMPVVSTKHCDIPNVIEDGVGGLLAEERDVDGLVERLHGLIERPQDWKAMTAAARERIETEFDIRRQAGLLAQIYRSVSNA